VAIIDGMISRIGLAALFGFVLRWDCFGFWMGDALAGFMPLIIGSVFYLSGGWRLDRNGTEE
jgi:Na+-driven multidrug efflux pump